VANRGNQSGLTVRGVGYLARSKIDRPRQEFPFKVEAPDLKAEPNEVPIEPIELPDREGEGPPDD
jgi:hypothetical protein